MSKSSNCTNDVIDLSSGDDTDCEVIDEFSSLDPDVLEVHLNCSSETGVSDITIDKDVQFVCEVDNNSQCEATRGYDNSRYFRKRGSNAAFFRSEPSQSKNRRLCENDDLTLVMTSNESSSVTS